MTQGTKVVTAQRCRFFIIVSGEIFTLLFRYLASPQTFLLLILGFSHLPLQSVHILCKAGVIVPQLLVLTDEIRRRFCTFLLEPQNPLK